MSFTVQEIAAALNAECAGEVDLLVERATEPSRAAPGDLALAMDQSYAEALSGSAAEVAVLWEGADWQSYGLKAAIFVSRPRYAMVGITEKFDLAPEIPPGIHPTAIVDPSAKIGANASIGPFTLIGARVEIGDNARILSHVSIGEDTKIGPDCLIYSGARIGSRVTLGARLVVHYNAIIGGDGFSFVTPEPSAVEKARAQLKSGTTATRQAYSRISSNGSVRLGDDIEVGSCATIDKGTVVDTEVGDGTKIDNHVQIGHNSKVGRHCLLCGHSGVAGSSVVGDRCVLGGQSGVADHLILGDDVIIAGGTGVISNVPSGRVMMGYPAVKIEQNIASYKALRRLPRLMAKLEDLQKQVSKLTGKP